MITRFRICKLCGEMHDLARWPDNHRYEIAPQRAINVPIPNFVRDDMPDTFHPCDDRTYASKSEFRRVTKENGGIEMGNDEQKFTRYYDTAIKDDIYDAMKKVEEGYRPDLQTAGSEVNIVT